MALNAAGLNVAGANNPRWNGGLLPKNCEVCGAGYAVKKANKSSRFCSQACVAVSQKGRASPWVESRQVEKKCEVCATTYFVPASHADRHHCCSKPCSFKRRSLMGKGENNPSWSGGLSRFPYPWNFKEISKKIIKRDGGKCQNHMCAGSDPRLTTHHINYEKADCRPENLICLCSACNSKANFGRTEWMAFYQLVMLDKKDGGGWLTEEF